MKVKLVEVGDGLGTALLPIPTSILDQLRWNEGDEVRLELVTDRNGVCTHIVVEKVEVKGG